MISRLLILILFVLSPALVLAQRTCGMKEYDKMKKDKPGYESPKQFEEWIQRMRQRTPGEEINETVEADTLVIIPVVVHVIHNGEPEGTGTNISDEQILSQIEVLNEDFRKLNADTVNTPLSFQPLATDLLIQFQLALQDPDGLPTAGILRTQGARTSWSMSQDEELKATSYWPAEEYFNMWVAPLSSNLLGYAQFPESTLPGLEFASTNRLTDGVVVSPQYFGSVDKGFFPEMDDTYNLGRTMTHEVGHFLGLRHTSGDSGCGVDDFCDDTPLQGSDTFGCPSNGSVQSCGFETMFQNYMDFTDDACMNLFTACQKSRVDIVLANSPRRLSLLTSPGLLPPDLTDTIYNVSIDPDELIAPSFATCEGSISPQFKLKNKSTIEINVLTIRYSFDSQQPSVITYDSLGLNIGEKRTITLPQRTLASGSHSFSIEVADPEGVTDEDLSDNIVTRNFIIDAGTEIAPLRQNFEFNMDLTGWSVIDQDNDITWERVAAPGNGGSNNTALFIDNFDNTNLLTRDILVSPILDFSNAETVNMFFKTTYGYVNGKNDRLRILVSDNCGVSYPFVLYNETGVSLGVGEVTTEWSPETSADWRTRLVDMGSFTGDSTVRVAFEMTNQNGNNLYLDDIEFFTDDDGDPSQLGSIDFKIYPNPSDGVFKVRFFMQPKQDVDVFVYDSRGNLIATTTLPQVLNQTFDFTLAGKPSGMYYMRVISPALEKTLRFYISHR